jgi:hypothetical protein
MKVTKLYIGSQTGSNSEVKQTFTKEEVVNAIEIAREAYNRHNTQWEGYTLYTTDGYWNGVQETSYVLEVMDNDFQANNIAQVLKNILKQDCIMISEQYMKVEFI